MSAVRSRGLGWPAIVRLGLVQTAIGAMVVIATSLLNRVMVVELALPATLPAALVAWHYAVQMARPRFGHGSDAGGRRTPWIVGGMAALALGTMLATDATLMLAARPAAGTVLAIAAFALIGGGVGAAGTSLLALLSSAVAPARQPAAAACTWIMMIAGFALASAAAGAALKPFSPARLSEVVAAICTVALLLALVAVWGIEGERPPPVHGDATPPLRAVLAEIWADRQARQFTLFVALSMLAFSAQDLILEPFAGLRFGMSPAQSTTLSSYQHGGSLIGMIACAVAGNAFARGHGWMRGWTIAGCLGSALALAGLAAGARAGGGWPLAANIGALGFANGVFAVAAVGSMMGLAGATQGREGARMGVWGAAQAIGFGLGGFLGAAGVDGLRALTGDMPGAFATVFAVEAALFVAAAVLALQVGAPRSTRNFVGAGA